MSVECEYMQVVPIAVGYLKHSLTSAIQNPHTLNLLILILICLIVDNVEEPQLIHALRSGNDTQPVTELLLLKELFCPVRRLVSRDLLQTKDIAWLRHSQVLEVAAREFLVRDNLDLAVTLLRDLDGVAEVTGTAVNLYAVVKELLKGSNIEDLVICGLGGVDDELLDARYISHCYDKFST